VSFDTESLSSHIITSLPCKETQFGFSTADILLVKSTIKIFYKKKSFYAASAIFFSSRKILTNGFFIIDPTDKIHAFLLGNF
jgi:hypothetical protein